jgi:hypothetical protein
MAGKHKAAKRGLDGRRRAGGRRTDSLHAYLGKHHKQASLGFMLGRCRSL